MNWLNLGVIIVLIYTAKTGFGEGLVTGAVKVFILFWAILAAFTFLEPLSDGLQKFLIQNQWQARIVSFWLLFLVVAVVLWGTLGKRLRKEKVALLPCLDHFGGLVSGLLFGAILSGFLVTSIYMAPLKGEDKGAFAFLERPVLFRIDELLPRFYGLMARKELAEGEEKAIYSFEEFMYEYNYIKGKKYKPEPEGKKSK